MLTKRIGMNRLYFDSSCVLFLQANRVVNSRTGFKRSDQGNKYLFENSTYLKYVDTLLFQQLFQR